MKVVKQVFQGISADEHVTDALSFLNQDDVKELLLVSSAYIRSTGTRRLGDVVDISSFKKKKAYVGINNQSSSIQGVRALIESGFDTYIVNTNRMDAIFHPKVYLARGKFKAILVTGSANLTGQGLAANFEHVLVLEFDLTIPCEKNEVDKLEHILTSLPALYPINILSALSIDLEEYSVKGWIENEMDFKHRAETKGMFESQYVEGGEKIKLPPMPKLSNSKEREEVENEIINIHSPLGSGTIVWKKNKLSKSDAQISGGKSTNVKGYMTMGNKGYRRTEAGLLVDNKKYMRHDVFKELLWKDNADFDREETSANFELWIDNVFIEKKRLMITNKASRDPIYNGGQYQKQPTTALHVCGFSEESFRNVLDKNLILYKLDPMNYRIEIL